MQTNVTEAAKKAFASQTFLGWKDALQGRFARAWQALSLDKKWRKPLLLELRPSSKRHKGVSTNQNASSHIN